MVGEARASVLEADSRILLRGFGQGLRQDIGYRYLMPFHPALVAIVERTRGIIARFAGGCFVFGKLFRERLSQSTLLIFPAFFLSVFLYPINHKYRKLTAPDGRYPVDRTSASLVWVKLIEL